MTIEIRNLHRNAIETDLRRLFTPFGELGPVEILRDRNNSRSMGRAIVNMPVDKEAKQAATSLNGSLILGQAIQVNLLLSSGTEEKGMGFI